MCRFWSCWTESDVHQFGHRQPERKVDVDLELNIKGRPAVAQITWVSAGHGAHPESRHGVAREIAAFEFRPCVLMNAGAHPQSSGVHAPRFYGGEKATDADTRQAPLQSRTRFRWGWWRHANARWSEASESRHVGWCRAVRRLVWISQRLESCWRLSQRPEPKAGRQEWRGW